MSTILRFLQVFVLGTWLGGIIYLSFVVAPALFSTLSNRDEAGAVVGVILAGLHILGVIAAIVFLLAAVALARAARGLARPSSALVIVMLLLTLASQLWVAPHMAALRTQMGSYMNTPWNNPLRAQFDHLHRLSVHLEGAVLLLGLLALFLTVRERPFAKASSAATPARS